MDIFIKQLTVLSSEHIDSSFCRSWLTRNVVLSTQKGTKNALETGRTFATLFADMDLRLRLLVARTEGEFKKLMWEHGKRRGTGGREGTRNREDRQQQGQSRDRARKSEVQEGDVGTHEGIGRGAVRRKLTTKALTGF